jgi:hypothetical protein
VSGPKEIPLSINNLERVNTTVRLLWRVVYVVTKIWNKDEDGITTRDGDMTYAKDGIHSYKNGLRNSIDKDIFSTNSTNNNFNNSSNNNNSANLNDNHRQNEYHSENSNSSVRQDGKKDSHYIKGTSPNSANTNNVTNPNVKRTNVITIESSSSDDSGEEENGKMEEDQTENNNNNQPNGVNSESHHSQNGFTHQHANLTPSMREGTVQLLRCLERLEKELVHVQYQSDDPIPSHIYLDILLGTIGLCAQV